MRTLKAGLDLRKTDIEEGRRRMLDVQSQINGSIAHYVALRTGMRAEVEEMGPLARPVLDSMGVQDNLLARQRRELDDERFLRSAVRDEVRRLREAARSQPVPEGTTGVFAAPPGHRPGDFVGGGGWH